MGTWLTSWGRGGGGVGGYKRIEEPGTRGRGGGDREGKSGVGGEGANESKIKRGPDPITNETKPQQ
jgi:hypothetical protein